MNNIKDVVRKKRCIATLSDGVLRMIYSIFCFFYIKVMKWFNYLTNYQKNDYIFAPPNKTERSILLFFQFG